MTSPADNPQELPLPLSLRFVLRRGNRILQMLIDRPTATSTGAVWVDVPLHTLVEDDDEEP